MEDRDYSLTIATGERNRDTAQLIRNWCGHARVERMGGRGMIEAMSGLPIGHQSMACDHAPAGGMACWELRDAVVDFYDRNCSTCTVRKPIRLPNISEIIGERDRLRADHERREEAASKASSEALALRDKRRDELSHDLDAVGRTILDDIRAFDHDRSDTNRETLIAAAKMAPEKFDARLVAYIADLTNDEKWFEAVGVHILQAIDHDQVWVMRRALAAFAAGHSSTSLVDIILDLVGHDDEASVMAALPALIALASPDYSESFGRRLPCDARPLQALWPRHRVAMLAAAEAMLLSRKRHRVEAAGRMLERLQQVEPDAADTLARTMCSVFVRAHQLLDDLKKEDDPLPHLAEALIGILSVQPEMVDGLLQEYGAGPHTTAADRVPIIYSRALATGRDAPVVPADSRRYRISLSRLIWSATTLPPGPGLQVVGGAFRHMSAALTEVVRAEIEALVGASLLIDQRIDALDQAPKQENETWLDHMERGNVRSSYNQFVSNFLEWAAQGARGDAVATDQFLELVDAIPQDRELLRGRALGALSQLAGGMEGLRRLLPYLYKGLVGASVIGRGLAAKALGDMSSKVYRDLPPLMFESFLTLLDDPYVYAHKNCVRALSHMSVPEQYRQRIAVGVMGLLHHYRIKSDEQDFTVDCIELVAGMADEYGSNSAKARQYLIDSAMMVEPIHLHSEIPSLAYTLGVDPSFGKLAARMLPELADGYNQSVGAEQLLERTSAAAISAYQTEFEGVALAIAETDLSLSLRIVEKIAVAVGPSAGEDLARRLEAVFPDTANMRARRQAVHLPLLALRFELAAASADADGRVRLRAEWDATVEAIEARRKDYRERNDRTAFPFAL